MTTFSGRRQMIKLAVAALVAMLTAVPTTSVVAGTSLNLGQAPLFLGGVVSPNIMFTLDDSGSMAWSYMPDTIAAYYGRPQGLAHTFNSLAYNPSVTYAPPVRYDASGTRITLTAATFTGAWDDGYAYYTQQGSCPNTTVDLATAYRPTWDYADSRGQYNCDSANTWFDEARGLFPEYWGAAAGSTALPTGERAFYYIYNTSLGGVGTCPNPADPLVDQCYQKKTITAGDTFQEQNFANWYSFYRKRTMLAKAGISQAFADVANDNRVGFGRINSTSQTVDGASTQTLRLGVKPFTGTARHDFFSELFKSPASGGTPLRRATTDVGNYFLRTGTLGPWDATPGVDDTANTTDSRCRQSYHLLMSDGYWNDDVTIGDSGGDNLDGRDFENYKVGDPFRDAYSNTLADFAIKYWATDLQSLANLVPVNAKDDATWQHLVTFGIGLGLSGLTVDPAKAFAAINTKSAIAWPDPFNPLLVNAKLDDLLHASVNSRGAFLLANDAPAFKAALTEALKDISERSGSAASVVLNSAALQSDTALFQAKFYSPDWYGSLLAYEIQANGSLNPTPLWDANSRVPSEAARKIATFNGTKGVPFTWTSTPNANTMTAAQLTSIGSEAVLNYVRGTRSGEGSTFRRRQSVLGDIVNSAPVYVAAPVASYRDYWIEGLDPDNIDKTAPENASGVERYSTYRYNNRARAPRLYVGANDGMLHAFDAKADATGGGEMFAFVPSKVVANLNSLSNPSYAHQYFVDGTPTVGDAFWDGKWRTVLVGGLNRGGQSIYALDITDPTATDYEKKVLWEFTDFDTASSGIDGHADLGYTYSRPNIVRLANDKWAAVFGNGYNNSGSGNAALFIVDLETGKLVTSEPLIVTATDPTGAGRTNGMATVAPVDIDGDDTVDYVYGGDLFGNLWKFNLTSAKPSDWVKSANKFLLFKAVSSNGTAQAITTRPQVVRHPKIVDKQQTVLVLFGTGKYLEPTVDNTQTGQATQTFYGIWDDGSTGASTLTRAALLKQEILGEEVVNGYAYRVTTDNQVTWIDSKDKVVNRGWYLDLVNTENGNTNNYGERQVSDSLVRNGRIIFTTLIPNNDPCSFGGDGWLMELDVLNGGRPPYPVFDVDNNGVFNIAGDYVDFDGAGTGQPAAAPSGRKSAVGIVPTPAILSREGGGAEYKYQPGAKAGTIEVVKENPGPGDFGRNSWIQLFR
jgi:type IV pilus assembly protein PilY1